MTGYIIAAVALVVILFVIWFFIRSSPYKKIFSEAHYLEFAEKLQASASTASERIGQIPTDPDQEDPRFFVTSAGLACAYSINEENDLFDHHYSISVVGRPTPHAVGAPYTVFVARLLGLSLDRLQTGVSQNRVHHSMMQVTRDQQEAFRQRETSLSAKNAARIFAECQTQGARLKFESFKAEPATAPGA